MSRLEWWSNEDGEGYVPTSSADQDAAGQAIADDTGLLVVAAGEVTTTLRECECEVARDDCPENDGAPCKVAGDIDCWFFETHDAGVDGWRDLRDWRPEGQLYWPKGEIPAEVLAELAPEEPMPIPVAPGQVEAGL